MEKYEKFGDLLMPTEQMRKIVHWEKSDEANKMLLIIKDTLKTELVASAKKLRLELKDKVLYL